MSHEPTGEGYEIFAVTADKGIRAWGANPAAVFRQAARALSSLLVDQAGVRARQTRPLEVSADDREALLVAWLNELLFVYETERFVLADCEIARWTDTHLAAVARGEILDPGRHVLVGHVKAVTYHQLQVRQLGQAWEARVVVDV